MRYKITANDLLQDLQLAKEIAIKNENANSLIAAVMAQARLLGLDNGNALTVSKPKPIAVTVQMQDARKPDKT